MGLGTSAVLLALAVLLVRAPDGHDAAINTVGVLQLLWLVNGRPSLREQVSQVDEPTIDNLRAAGMFEVRVASEMKGDDGSYKLVRLESSDDRARYGLSKHLIIGDIRIRLCINLDTSFPSLKSSCVRIQRSTSNGVTQTMNV